LSSRAAATADCRLLLRFRKPALLVAEVPLLRRQNICGPAHGPRRIKAEGSGLKPSDLIAQPGRLFELEIGGMRAHTLFEFGDVRLEIEIG
jgi:hypothetical protein